MARDLIGRIFADSRASAFGTDEMLTWARQLAAFGFAAERIPRMLRTIQDTARGLGGGPDLVSRMVLAMGQIKAKGTLQGEEALQLTEAGLPVRQWLGIPKGKDIAEMGIDADEGINRILAGADRLFGGMQAKATRAWSGLLANLTQSLRSIAGLLTQGMLAQFEKALELVNRFAESLQRTAQGQAILSALQRGFNAVGTAAIRFAERLPDLARWLGDALQSERFQRFQEFATHAFTVVKDVAAAVVAWLGENWERVWQGIANAARTGARLLAGIFGGIVAGVRYPMAQGEDWRLSWREILVSIGEMLQRWAVVGGAPSSRWRTAYLNWRIPSATCGPSSPAATWPPSPPSLWRSATCGPNTSTSPASCRTRSLAS